MERTQARALLEAVGDEPQAKPRRFVADPVDLRGIPAIGPGIGGTMRGTQPEAETVRRLSGE